MDFVADKPKIKRGDSKKRLSTHGIRGGGAGAVARGGGAGAVARGGGAVARGGGAGAVARGGGEYKANRKGKKQASQDPCASSGTVLANLCKVAKFNYTFWWIMFLDML